MTTTPTPFESNSVGSTPIEPKPTDAKYAGQKTAALPVSADIAKPAGNQERAKRIRLVVRILLAIVALILLFKIGMVGLYGWRVYQSLEALRSLDTNSITLEKVASVQPEVRQLSAGMAGLERELRFAAPVLHRLGGVPQWGGLLSNTPELLVAGKELTAILNEGLTIVGPALSNGTPLVGENSVLSLLGESKAQFAAMEQHALVATVALKNTDLAALHPTLAANDTFIQTLLRVFPAFFQIAPSLPHLIGSDAPQTYLILVQNNHELRATGGFITAVGKVKLDNGEITDLYFSDSYDVYSESSNYPKAPAAQQKYMRIPILVFRDGNWSPDLPTSAQTLKAIYFQDTGVSVNGIITVDINALQTLIDALGPLKIEGSDEEITGASIVDFLKKLWERPLTTEGTVDADKFDVEWWERRKDFIPALAKAVLQRVQTGDFDKLAVLKSALRSLDQRFVQVWVDDSDAEKALAWQGWDGGLQPEAGADFLALIDSNMGYNKVDSVLNRKLDYQLVWPQGNNGPAQATVTIVYDHPFEVPSEDACNNTPRYGDSYDEMAARCYFDYVRLYTPSGSKLIEAQGFAEDSVETFRGEKGTQVLAGYFVMKPGTRHVVRFTYTLPDSIKVDGYRLVLQKQSGLVALPVTLEVNSRRAEIDLAEGLWRWNLQSR